MALILRPATEYDDEMMLRWRQDDEAASPWWEGKPVDRERHMKWFHDRINNAAVRLWIAEEDGVPVGDARLDSNGEVTYNTLPEFRRRGFGTAILLAATHEAVADGWTRVKANVDLDNIASQGTLDKAGYHHRPDVLFYRWPK